MFCIGTAGKYAELSCLRMTAAILLICVLGAFCADMCIADGRGELYVVSAPAADVYADVYDDSERLTQVLLNEPVRCPGVEPVPPYVKVVVPNQYRGRFGYEGWIRSDCIVPVRQSVYEDACSWEAEPCPAPCLRRFVLNGGAGDSLRRVMVCEPEAFLYREPDCSQDPVSRIFASSALILASDQKAEGEDGRLYWQVEYPGTSEIYFLPAEYGITNTLPSERAAVIRSAGKFAGTPYLWGGMSRAGIDCSGFVYSVCRMHGITVPRDADQQFEAGREIDSKDIKPGDILFFGRDRQHISHVGFALGNGCFLDASGKYGVSRSSLSGSRNIRGFVGARRYFER